MNDRSMLMEEGLPPAAAEQLRVAARVRTAGSVPFPRVHEAVRRDRRRRAAGGAVVGIAAVLAATLVTSAVRADRPTLPASRGAGPTPAAQTPPRTPEPGADSDPLDLAGRTAGALGSDAAWIRELKERIVQRGKASDAAHARVLWATDHEERRFALTIAENRGGWSLESWRGPAGAAPAAMGVHDGSGFSVPAGEQPELEPTFLSFRVSDDQTKGDGLLVVVGRGLSDVEVASDFDYAADGRKTATWRPLDPDAAVWVREVTAAEIDGMKVRARRPDGLREGIGGGGVYGQAPMPLGMADVAPPGTDPEVLNCAAMAFAPARGGFPKGSTPVLGGAPQVGKEWYGIAVAEAPGGGYLIGTCLTLHPEWSSSSGAESAWGWVVPAPKAGGAAELFALVPTKTDRLRGSELEDAVLTAVVVAPEEATEVEVAGVTAPVRDRLAVLTLPKDTPADGLTATARAADGTSLGTTGPAEREWDVDRRSFFDVDELGEPFRR